MHQQALYNQQNVFANIPNSPNMSYSSKPNGPPIEDLFDTIKSNEPNKSIYQDSFLAYGNNGSMMQNSYGNMSMNNQSITSHWQDGCQEQDEYWITVFGFPPNAANTVLARFSNCGAILGKNLNLLLIRSMYVFLKGSHVKEKSTIFINIIPYTKLQLC